MGAGMVVGGSAAVLGILDQPISVAVGGILFLVTLASLIGMEFLGGPSVAVESRGQLKSSSDSAPARAQKQSDGLHTIIDKHYKNEVVKLDGNGFLNCKFTNVRLNYAGGETSIENSEFIDRCSLETDNQSVVRFQEMLAYIESMSGAKILETGYIDATGRTHSPTSDDRKKDKPH